MTKKIIAGLAAIALLAGTTAFIPEDSMKILTAMKVSAEAGSELDSYVDSGEDTYGDDSSETAVDYLTDGDFGYRLLDDGTAEIIGYSGSDEDLTIPSAVNGTKVTAIGDFAFLSGKSITIPDGVTRIGMKGIGAYKLENVVIPDSVTYIGQEAFEESRNLKSIKLPENLTYIGGLAFWNSALTELVIPANVKTIDSSAFFGCENLKEVTILSRDAEIGEGAFGHVASGTVDGFTIKCYKDSTAYEYAVDNGFNVVLLDEAESQTEGSDGSEDQAEQSAAPVSQASSEAASKVQSSNSSTNPKTGVAAAAFGAAALVAAAAVIKKRK